jgi:hypothetical protein
VLKQAITELANELTSDIDLMDAQGSFCLFFLFDHFV